jgi:predicted MFS family arabinose efflux permease
MNMPARQSLMAELVPRRLMHNATSLHTASMNLNRIVGPAASGLLLAAIGALPVMLINVVANSWTVWQLTLVKYRPSRPTQPFRVDFEALSSGFRYCWEHRPVLRVMAIIAITNFFGLSYVDLLAPLARDTLGLGPGGFGLMLSTMGGGALLGAMALAPLRTVRRKEPLLSLTAAALGLLMVLLGRADGLPQACLALALAGLCSAAMTAFGLQAIQERVSDEVSGRVFGVYMLVQGLTTLGTLPAGLLAAQIGTGPAIAIWGLLCALLSTVLLALGQLTTRQVAESATTRTVAGT